MFGIPGNLCELDEDDEVDQDYKDDKNDKGDKGEKEDKDKIFKSASRKRKHSSGPGENSNNTKISESLYFLSWLIVFFMYFLSFFLVFSS